MFLDIVINTIDEYGMIKKDDCITAALSGGADSVCLLLILKELSDKYSFTLDALHIIVSEEKKATEMRNSAEISVKNMIYH